MRVATELQVPIKILVLHFDRRVIPVTVEACFADRANAGHARQLFDDLEITLLGFGGRVGLNADGCEKVSRMSRRQFTGSATGGDIDANHHDAGHASLFGSLNHLVDAVVKLADIQVRVGVKK